MRSLGEAWGHLVRAARADVGAGVRREEVRRETEERVVETGDGPVTLRRTVIEEIEVRGRGG